MRSHGGTIALVLVAAACAPGRPAAAPAAPPPPLRPNLIVVVTDDMAAEDLDHLPRIKSLLVDRGATFTRAFVTDSVCTPSRASILTGRYPHNHGALDNTPPLGGFKKFREDGREALTFATWLQAAGYRTALVGKYINGYPGADHRYVPSGWDEWYALFFPEPYYDYEVNHHGLLERHGDQPPDYQTDVLAARAVDFVSQLPTGGERQPFLLYLAPHAPHQPDRPATRHETAFAGLRAPRPPSFDEEDVSAKPGWVRAQARLTPEVVDRIDDLYRRRLRTLLAVDEMVERILHAVAARGELDSTYVFLTSDNGFQLGAHRLDHGKGDAYEESIRVPLVVRGPGVRPGTCEEPVLNIDYAPTLAELAGTAAPAGVDGRSFVPLLHGRAPGGGKWRTDFLVEHWTADEGGIPPYSALRSSSYLYVEYPEEERELYDLRADPYELHNVHAAADPSLRERLSRRLAALKACAGATCRDE
jgi:N-acetylglucosamine-6-sulfatase